MRKNRPFITMGLTLLVTVLLVALLVSFSLLSLSAARQDHARAQDLAQRRQEYYAASNIAEQILHQLKTGEPPAHPVQRQEGIVSYAVPICENQTLYVALDESTLEILRWQAVTE